MIQFVIIFVLYFALMKMIFSSKIAPIGKKIEKRMIPFPSKFVTWWILVANALFPLSSIIRARKSGWSMEESMTAMSTFLGIFLGMIVDY